MATVALLTDFGLADAFVGAMKGVILSRNPAARVVDISHQVPPGDVKAAAFVLGTCHAYFPAGTVHVAVVDPGVGSPRRPVAVRCAGQLFVAPDNGLLSYVLADPGPDEAVAIASRKAMLPRISRTFHGRDVFAPAAAHLSLGLPMSDLGPPVRRLVRLDMPRPQVGTREIEAHVIYVDGFGNAITDLTERQFEKWRSGRRAFVEAGGAQFEAAKAYADGRAGRPLAVFGSSGRLEVAVRGGSAAGRLLLVRGSKVVVRLRTR
jgi:S-adenosylmethionine hydrolase